MKATFNFSKVFLFLSFAVWLSPIGSVEDAQGLDLATGGNIVDAGSYTSFSSAIDAIGGRRSTLLINNQTIVLEDKTVPQNVGLMFLNGGELDVRSGVKVAINGPLDAGLYQIFSGTGSVSIGQRSVKEVHPEWWGAVADNLTDAGPAIQKSIDASPEGSVIRFGGGTYLTSAKIVFGPDRSYIGDSHSGSGTVIKQMDSSNISGAIFVSSGWVKNGVFADNRVIFRDLLIHGNKENNKNAQTHGVLSMNYYSVFENITVFGTTGDGIRFTDQNSVGATIKKTAVGNKVIHCKFIKCGGSGIRGDDHGSILTDGYLIDNEIGSCGEYGIYIARGAGWKALGNYIYGAGLDGIFFGRGWNSQILGNTIDNFGLNSTGGVASGIVIGAISDNVPCLINDNIISLPRKIEGKIYRGISVTSGWGVTMAEVIVGNNIARFPGSGTFFGAGGNGGGSIHLTGNKVSGAEIAISRSGDKVLIVHSGNSFDLTFELFADGDSTPSVLNGAHFRVANRQETIITGFDDGFEGQRIMVVFDSAKTTLDFAQTSLRGNSGVAWVPNPGDFMECVFSGSVWNCFTGKSK
ncbi:MAG: right-handed parallel beta-helix repeat-containing protein [Proteobacteria bacterium]|nr:right-handed parallel beta-helix repeat-containing protein [Pseudomonadota bacterium]MBU1738862.1 right-handed parallel beta-helix repeat-containing protein [Pseudomonadota bacterium]